MKKARNPRAKPFHPRTYEMVNNAAIQSLKEREGSFLQTIKKYASGALVQTKSKGASGSCKLPSSAVSKQPSSESEPHLAPKGASKRGSDFKPKAKKAAAKKPAASSAAAKADPTPRRGKPARDRPKRAAPANKASPKK